MKPTAINIAKFYGVSRETIRNYRDGSIEKQRLYFAMVEYFKKENEKWKILKKNQKKKKQ